MKNADEAVLINEFEVIPASSLLEVRSHLNNYKLISRHKLEQTAFQQSSANKDLSDIRAQYFAKRALEVAAADGRNMLMARGPRHEKNNVSRTTVKYPAAHDG